MTTRVLQIIPTLDRGGAEKQMTLLASRLPRDRFEVFVAALTRSGPLASVLADAGIPLIEINKRWKIDPAALWRLRREIARLQPDVVHTWIFAANSYGRQAAFQARVPYVIAGERCVDPWKSWHELAIDRHLAARTWRIATNSGGVRDFYVQKGLPADKFVIIPNGIAPRRVDPPLTREQMLDELQLPSDARVIGAVGRLWPQKRYKDLIWALKLLKIVHENLHLVVIGEGPQRWRLERFVRQSEVTRNVHLVGHRHDVPSLMPHFDLFWLGSGYEGQSNALMEAMLAGLPTVVSDIPGNRELVVDGETGYVVPLGNMSELTRQTHWLLEHPDQAAAMGEAGRRRMLSDFSVERMVDRHAELYEQRS